MGLSAIGERVAALPRANGNATTFEEEYIGSDILP